MTDLAMGRSGAFDIGKVIERTFGVIGANFPTLFGLALVLMMRFRPEGLLPSKRVQHELHEQHP